MVEVWPRQVVVGLEGPSLGDVAMHSVTCILSTDWNCYLIVLSALLSPSGPVGL